MDIGRILGETDSEYRARLIDMPIGGLSEAHINLTATRIQALAPKNQGKHLV